MMNDDRFELTVAEKFHSVAPYLELVFEGQNSPDDALGQMVDLLGESYLILDRESGKYILLKSLRILTHGCENVTISLFILALALR